MPDKPLDNRKQESLDEIVSHSAVVLADQIQKAAQWAKSEMDLQIEVAGVLKEFARKAQIKLEGHHNITIATGHKDQTGRPDSVYGGVIVEYKTPGTLSPRRDAAPNRALVDQIKSRFYAFNRDEGRNWPSMFGVGTDGKYFLFVRFREDKWNEFEPQEVDPVSTRTFLWRLYNLGQKGKPYQPEYLHGDFGAESKIAQEGVRTLYEEFRKADDPRAQVFFNQWKILFGEVCGYDVENLSDKLKKLAEFYFVGSNPQPAHLLFALHTYYALLLKLISSEIVHFYHLRNMPGHFQRLVEASTSSKLQKGLSDLELKGGIFHELGVTNFLEGDLFSWYLGVWGPNIEKVVRKMIEQLDEYNPGTISEDPVQSRDLLKKLYQQLFPKSVRHDLGEYYTPDWLAEHVLNELGYKGDPDKRLLDPACGSGTFLVMAINRIRRWYDSNREKCAYDEGDLLKKILANVIGFDLNPLAVMAARTNYLVAIKDLIRHVDQVEIPVYLCDSIMTPIQLGSQKAQRSFLAETGVQYDPSNPPIAVKTAVGIFLVPPEIATSRDRIEKYAEVLEKCIKGGYSKQQFLTQCDEEGLAIGTPDTHLNLYAELVRLDKDNKNGIWARIIKNNFAPLFVGKVDYVAGNPPWVNWESLPEDYRDGMKALWQRYGLFTLSGSAGRLGGGKKDLSMLFVYTAVDHYLLKAGRLGFVITQTVFKTKGAGDGFRQFSFERDKKRVFLKPLVVHDLSDMQVFEGATNRTSVFICERQEKAFEYPVPYIRWSGPSRTDQDEELTTVLRHAARREMRAIPVEKGKPSSPWLTTSGKALRGVQKVLGQSSYRAFAGSCTWLNGVYWVQIIQQALPGMVLVENLYDVGKIKVEQVRATIESDLLYLLLRGRGVERWKAAPSAHIILTQDVKTRNGIPEPVMKRDYPKTFEYLRRFEGQLRKRSGFRKYFNTSDPFYSIYNVGPYTLARWKVVWRDMGSEIQVAVIGQKDGKKICPEHHVMFVPFETADEAHFLCAVLMSAPVQLLVSGYTTTTGISTHVLEYVAVPPYNSNDRIHKLLANLSEQCHVAANKNDRKSLASLEKKVDEIAANLWSITGDELKSIQEARAEAKESGRGGVEEEDDE